MPDAPHVAPPDAAPPADDELAVAPPDAAPPADDELAVAPPDAAPPADDELAVASQRHLCALAGDDAVLRPDQLLAIRALVADRARVLVVQRTGWGKSAVYWVATALRRAGGAGPTLVVSPLLALMRDQVAAASRMGLRAVTLNSSNIEDWSSVEQQIASDGVDVLLISPERLNSPGFRSRVLPHLADRIGLLVVDEAHCISEWGFDFRPDYRRIADVIAGLSQGTPVLATTATANARVTTDVAAQLGPRTVTLRGTLDRESLALDVVATETAAHRYAWVACALDVLPGTGIVYTLTVAEAERLAAWLRHRGHDVRGYTGGIDADVRLEVEADLRAGRLKAVVATSALGMGFDHPTLAFVLHSGAPSSAIAYYQQVGRAGRALDSAVAVLLPGQEDAAIWEYFTSTAMPPRATVEKVLDVLASSTQPMTLPALEAATGLRRGRLEALCKVLDVDGAVVRDASGWSRTSAAYVYDADRHVRVEAARRAEQSAMRAYLVHDGCLMEFLRSELDDPGAAPCGRCARCIGRPVVEAQAAPGLVREALEFLRGQPVVIEPRKMWPAGLDGRRGRIGGSTAEQGRALALGRDAGWGDAVAEALAADSPVSDDVLDGVIQLLGGWGWPAGRPTWVTWVPSRRRSLLVTDLAARLGTIGRLKVVEAFVRAADTPWQETLEGSVASARGAVAALRLSDDIARPPSGVSGSRAGPPSGPVLLVDDQSGSGWTLTVAAALLREAGAGPVYPLVLRRRP